MALGAPSASAAPRRPREFPTLGHVLEWRALREADQGAFVFLVDGEDHEQSLTYAQLDRQARAIAAELLRRGAPGPAAPRLVLASEPDAPALLQYTSGSTGTPGGVLIGHRTLLANLARIEQMSDIEGVIAVSWLPAYHDMGLIGCTFQPVFSG